MLRLVPSHPRRASARAHRVLRVLIERYSESSYRYRTDDWEAAFVFFASFHMGVSTGRSSLFHSDQDAANSGLHPEAVFWMEDRRCSLSFCGVQCYAPSNFVCFCFCFDTHGCVSRLSVFLSVFLSFCLSFSCHGSDNAFMCLCMCISHPPPNLSLTYRRAHREAIFPILIWSHLVPIRSFFIFVYLGPRSSVTVLSFVSFCHFIVPDLHWRCLFSVSFGSRSSSYRFAVS